MEDLERLVRMSGITMKTTKTLVNGLVTGGILAVISIAFIVGAWDVIEQRALEVNYMDDLNINDWAIRWAVIALVLASVLSLAFSWISANWNWTNVQYFILSIIVMITLDVLAFLPIYDSSVRVYPIAYLGLNAIFCIGLGTLIPFFNERSYLGRAVHW